VFAFALPEALENNQARPKVAIRALSLSRWRITRAIDCESAISRGRGMAVVCRYRDVDYGNRGTFAALPRRARHTGTENQTSAIALPNSFHQIARYFRKPLGCPFVPRLFLALENRLCDPSLTRCSLDILLEFSDCRHAFEFDSMNQTRYREKHVYGSLKDSRTSRPQRAFE